MNNLNILIADDHVLFGQGLEALIKSKFGKSRFRHAANGKEALEMVEKEYFDLIFMDIMMPVIDGIEATIEIKKKFKNIHVLAVTMMNDRANIVKMFKAGADGYILKNTTLKELEEAITTVLEGNKYYSKEVANVFAEKVLKNEIPGQKRGPYNTELTKRELEITILICQNYKNKEIGEILNISQRTVESHRTNIFDKLNFKNVIDLMYYAIDNNIITRGD